MEPIHVLIADDHTPVSGQGARPFEPLPGYPGGRRSPPQGKDVINKAEALSTGYSS